MYKRQNGLSLKDEGGYFSIVDGEKEEIVGTVSAVILFDSSNGENTIVPQGYVTVSYTHLDVYKRQYIDYIDEQYNSERLTGILCDVTDIIGANAVSYTHLPLQTLRFPQTLRPI